MLSTIILYHETSRDTKLYTVPVTGTVQQCESYQRTQPASFHRFREKTYYTITISYETDSAQQRKIVKTGLTRSYQNGEEVAIMVNPDTGKAILKSETVHNPEMYIFLSLLALASIAVGVICVKHALNEM